MQVGISNIGWQPDMVSKNTEIALNLGFDYIESAYIKAPLSKSELATKEPLLSRFQCNRGKSQLGLDNQVEVCNITLRGWVVFQVYWDNT